MTPCCVVRRVNHKTILYVQVGIVRRDHLADTLKNKGFIKVMVKKERKGKLGRGEIWGSRLKNVTI